VNKYLSVLLLISTLVSTHLIPQLETMPQHVATSYSHAMFGPKIHEKPKKEEERPSAFTLPKPETLTLQDRQAQEIAFQLVAENFQTDTSNVIDISFVDKMEIVAGGENTKTHLFGTIFDPHINTAVGTAFASLSLCTPTSNVTHIKNRQAVIQLLCENEHDLYTLDRLLQQIKKVEKDLLIFWDDQSPVNQQLLHLLYFGKYLNMLNTNTPVLEFIDKQEKIFQISLGFLALPSIMAILAWKLSPRGLVDLCKSGLTGHYANWNTRFLLVAIPGYQCFFAYMATTALKNKTEVCNHLQKILISTASYVRNLKQLGDIISKHKELCDYIPAFKHLVNLTNNASHSSNFNKLLSMLETNTFKGEPSFFSITGRVLAAYALMNKVKQELVPALNAAGELDTYIALAKAYKSYETKNVRYCFVEFIDADSPIVEAHEFWNPFIPLTEVVPNTISLDQNNPNIILTGPNTGGKSTIIKGLVIDLLLAQTFGIAPAEKLTITPFETLNCYLNITDNIAAGVSLFKAEVLRAKQLINMISNLPHDKFSFTVMDEVFSGTAPQEGEIAAYLFAKKLSIFDNNISIIATHYPKMIKLETDTNGAYKNYQVEVIREDDGRIIRTFKLLPGSSTINIAIDILKEEGVL